jgi:hypothetical protein
MQENGTHLYGSTTFIYLCCRLISKPDWSAWLHPAPGSHPEADRIKRPGFLTLHCALVSRMLHPPQSGLHAACWSWDGRIGQISGSTICTAPQTGMPRQGPARRVPGSHQTSLHPIDTRTSSPKTKLVSDAPMYAPALSPRAYCWDEST